MDTDKQKKALVNEIDRILKKRLTHKEKTALRKEYPKRNIMAAIDGSGSGQESRLLRYKLFKLVNKLDGPPHEKRASSKTQYTINGKIVSSVVSGGSMESGKR